MSRVFASALPCETLEQLVSSANLRRSWRGIRNQNELEDLEQASVSGKGTARHGTAVPHAHSVEHITIVMAICLVSVAYKSHLWRDTCADLGITAKKTRPHRPQTNGKIERFHRTLADGWCRQPVLRHRISTPKHLARPAP
jgi:transposase InsO family protein